MASSIPRPVSALVEAFERLPGIGPKSAQRLAYYMLHSPGTMLEDFAQRVLDIKNKITLCKICFNVSEGPECSICSDLSRDRSVIAVVEEPLDIVAVEKAGFKGLYHVLHGSISPLNNVGPEQLYIRQLLPRLQSDEVKEIILATNPTLEGEATAMYIQKLIKDLGVHITRIARGLPVGGDIEYADEVTLKRALEGRGSF